MNRKEYGSDFHYIDSPEWRNVNSSNSFFDDDNLSLYYSGRAALYSIIKNGIKYNAWHTIAVPSFYCHEVVYFIKSLPITVEYYEVTPFKDKSFNKAGWIDSEQTVVLIVDYFGMDKLDYSHLKKSIIIEDCTHNIESIYSSDADYCFGSLRKVIPIPVGGFCYFKNSKPIELAPANLQADNTAMGRLSAMYLKSLYLQGQFDNKDVFRNLYSTTEEKFANDFAFSDLPNLVRDYLDTLLISKIIKAKKDNLSLAKSLMKTNNSFELISSKENNDFALTMQFDTHRVRNAFRKYLIEHNIFPIVLWPNQFSDANKQFEETILFIHVDFRYNREDITLIVNKINQYFDNA